MAKFSLFCSAIFKIILVSYRVALYRCLCNTHKPFSNDQDYNTDKLTSIFCRNTQSLVNFSISDLSEYLRRNFLMEILNSGLTCEIQCPPQSSVLHVPYTNVLFSNVVHMLSIFAPFNIFSRIIKLILSHLSLPRKCWLTVNILFVGLESWAFWFVRKSCNSLRKLRIIGEHPRALQKCNELPCSWSLRCAYQVSNYSKSIFSLS